MSYLDLPRLNFGGLFFTNPDTMNNYIQSYNPNTKLKDSDGQYDSSGKYGGPAGWLPTGVAQLWMEQCTVLAATGRGGPAAASDPILGAPVESPSPQTPRTTPDGKGYYDIAKMVDLDPYQQSRSAVYGWRVFVDLPGGGGFSGLLSVPELQFLGGRVAAPTGSWAAVGTWAGELEDLVWTGDVSASPFLAELQEAAAHGLAFKVNMDLHQNSPNSQLISGNLFCYGRLLGSIGPMREGELPQTGPGRLLGGAALAEDQRSCGQAPASEAAGLAAAGDAAVSDTETRPLALTLDARMRARFAAREGSAPKANADAGLATAESAPSPWNCVVADVGEGDAGAVLHLDLGAALQCPYTQDSNGLFASTGQFTVESGMTAGYLDAGGGFQPFASGALSFANGYQTLDSTQKQVSLVVNGGIFDVPLTADEASAIASAPLAITLDGTRMAAEAADGLYLNLGTFSTRMEQGNTASVPVVARRFGRPVVGEQPASFTVDGVGGGAATDLAVGWGSATDANGVGSIDITATSAPLTLPVTRRPLDSLVYGICMFGPGGAATGDAPYQGTYNLTVLLFQQFEAPADPTWEDDVGPILQAYARLYPGMKSRLDIGDETTVQGFAPTMYARMAAPFTDPAYMPVTRDLCPSKIAMILAWLKTQLPSTQA